VRGRTSAGRRAPPSGGFRTGAYAARIRRVLATQIANVASPKIGGRDSLPFSWYIQIQTPAERNRGRKTGRGRPSAHRLDGLMPRFGADAALPDVLLALASCERRPDLSTTRGNAPRSGGRYPHAFRQDRDKRHEPRKWSALNPATARRKVSITTSPPAPSPTRRRHHHARAKPEIPIDRRRRPAGSCLGGFRTPGGIRKPSLLRPAPANEAVLESGPHASEALSL
jgi:hypothetical protein